MKWELKYPEKNREKTRRWRQANPNKAASYLKEWRTLNPDRVVVYNATRRGRRRGGEGAYTYEQWQALKESCGYKCIKCNLTEQELHDIGRKLVPDHIIPLSKDGTNDISNIQPLCHGKGGCNNIKGSNAIDYRPIC